MPDPALVSHVVHFGVFEADLRSGELRKHGLKVKIQEQPFRVLAMLLEQPGQIVAREELHKKLWPAETFVDFEHGLNAAINKLREALGDSADNPRFVETLHRRGYRFIAPVELHHPLAPSAERGGVGIESPPGSGGDQRQVVVGAVREPPLRRRWIVALSIGGAVALLAVLFALNFARIRDSILRGVGAVREPPLQIQSIAILPFDNLSHDPEQEYFADGMTEELITNLGKAGALRVISRTSVMRYKGTRKPLPEIAKELNVDALVEGTVLRSGNRVRITANLLQASTDRHLWAESYERDLGDVLSLQSEVASAITDEVKAKVTSEVQPRLARARPVNPEAYEAYLRGSTILDNWTEESGQSAIKYFERAIDRDPGFAPAFAGLADAYIFLSRFYYRPANETFPKAKEAARKALALDANSAEAYTSLCSVATFYDWDWRTAETACLRAIELNPSYGPAHHIYSHYLVSTGRFPESLRESLRLP